jgi:multidrug efflux pump subunit AcrA (membrane-fusion protein)
LNIFALKSIALGRACKTLSCARPAPALWSPPICRTPFAQVLDLDSAIFRIAIPERDAALLQAGQAAAIKLDSYPQRTWHNNVSIVSPEAQAADGVRTITAEVPVSNADAVLRAGMSGRAKIFIGWRPAGYVLLRAPALWVWQTLWDWIGW